MAGNGGEQSGGWIQEIPSPRWWRTEESKRRMRGRIQEEAENQGGRIGSQPWRGETQMGEREENLERKIWNDAMDIGRLPRIFHAKSYT